MYYLRAISDHIQLLDKKIGFHGKGKLVRIAKILFNSENVFGSIIFYFLATTISTQTNVQRWATLRPHNGLLYFFNSS